jgi:hypothetical protein
MSEVITAVDHPAPRDAPEVKRMKLNVSEVTEQETDSRMYEYTSAANPYMVR